jgi:hypothetical protein
MNSINIQLIILILIKLNECNQIELVKNKLKENFKFEGKSMDTKITEYKEEVKKGYFFILIIIKWHFFFGR